MQNPKCEPRVGESVYCTKTVGMAYSKVFVFVIGKGPNGSQTVGKVKFSFGQIAICENMICVSMSKVSVFVNAMGPNGF